MLNRRDRSSLLKRIAITVLSVGLCAQGPFVLPANPPRFDPTYRIELPPPYFDHDPDIEVIEMAVDIKDTDMVCDIGNTHRSKLEGGQFFVMILEKKVCIIFVPRG